MLDGYVLDGYVLDGYVLDGYVLDGYVLAKLEQCSVNTRDNSNPDSVD